MEHVQAGILVVFFYNGFTPRKMLIMNINKNLITEVYIRYPLN